MKFALVRRIALAAIQDCTWVLVLLVLLRSWCDGLGEKQLRWDRYKLDTSTLSKRGVGWSRYVNRDVLLIDKLVSMLETQKPTLQFLCAATIYRDTVWVVSAQGKGTFWALLSVAGRLATKSPQTSKQAKSVGTSCAH